MSLYEPEAGDLVWTDVDPGLGREQAGRRPALVISPVGLWRATRFLFVAPITSRIRPFPSSVVLPAGLKIVGEVLLAQTRSIDSVSRPIAFAGGSVPQDVLEDARAKLNFLLCEYASH